MTCLNRPHCAANGPHMPISLGPAKAARGKVRVSRLHFTCKKPRTPGGGGGGHPPCRRRRRATSRCAPRWTNSLAGQGFLVRRSSRTCCVTSLKRPSRVRTGRSRHIRSPWTSSEGRRASIRRRTRSSVQLRLPLGRYVPEFALASPRLEAAGDAPASAPGKPPKPVAGVAARPSRRFFFNALLGLCFSLIGVGLAVGLVRWSLPGRPSTLASVPDFPSVTVGSFDNLTGEAGLDGLTAQFGPQLSAALAKFDSIKVTPDTAAMVVHGSVEEKNGSFIVKALLSRGGSTGIVWSATITPASLDAGPALNSAVVSLAAQLGNASGPLHAPGRAWLAEQTTTTALPTLYLCDLRYMAWRDNRRMTDAATAIDCYNRLIATDADNAVALAAVSGIKAWRDHYTADPDADLNKLMADETTAAARAVSLQPADAFVYEQQGLVLARQGSLDAALGALGKAVELNPASMDALAANGLVLWLTQHYDDGNALAERTLSTISSPPPWYYMTRAFEALRERRYYDAIVAAQALAAGDEEYGLTVALAAAPVIGRSDIVD